MARKRRGWSRTSHDQNKYMMGVNIDSSLSKPFTNVQITYFSISMDNSLGWTIMKWNFSASLWPSDEPSDERAYSSTMNKKGRHFTDDIFKRIFLNENLIISIQYSMKFVPKGPIDNKLALVQVMAWCRIGDKPLPEPMLSQYTDANMRH